jgi:hypothetical protein
MIFSSSTSLLGRRRLGPRVAVGAEDAAADLSGHLHPRFAGHILGGGGYVLFELAAS